MDYQERKLNVMLSRAYGLCSLDSTQPAALADIIENTN
jgi:hypothetical protein